MKNLKLIISATLIALLSGCALTEYARDYLDNAVDVNQYETAKEIDDMLCEPNVLSRLQKTRSKKWYEETVADCVKRKEQSIPLSN